MTQDEIIEMARRAGFEDFDRWCKHYPQETQRWCQRMETFAKLVAAKAITKYREDFDIDELCARQNKIGYKQGYRAGQFAEREACAKVCEDSVEYAGDTLADAIRARGQA
jgi:hypothetical protein